MSNCLRSGILGIMVIGCMSKDMVYTSLVLEFGARDAIGPLMDRVENFANKVCGHVTVFDTKDYPIEGISEGFRDLMSPSIMAAMIERLSRHFEDKRKHNLNIRRYYKVMDY